MARIRETLLTADEARELDRLARRRQREYLFLAQAKGEALRGGVRAAGKGYNLFDHANGEATFDLFEYRGFDARAWDSSIHVNMTVGAAVETIKFLQGFVERNS